MSATGTTKRARMSDSVNLDSDDFQQSSEVWYEDGNIVLIASRTAFRVHQGVLMRHSPIFGDMLNTPQPVDDPENSHFGCPLVRLSDPPIELCHFLRNLYEGGAYTLRKGRMKFQEVANLVRIAHKYQVDRLWEDGINLMKAICANKLDVWERRKEADGHIRTSLVDFEPCDAITAVNVARLTNTVAMLPVALYLCCQLDPHVLLKGIPRWDGGIEHLSEDDFARCMTAMATMQGVWLSGIARACHSSCGLGSCKKSTATALFRYIRTNLELKCAILSSDGSRCLSQYMLDQGYNLCSTCKKELNNIEEKDSERTRLKNAWEELPLYLNLGTWEGML